MLSEIAGEVLRLLTRRDLDKACGVSKWLVAMIAQCCEVYPLRPVHEVVLYCEIDFTVNVWIYEDAASKTDRSFTSMNEAVHSVGTFLRHSYVERLMLGYYACNTPLSPHHWTTLINAIRKSDLRRLDCIKVDFSALDDDAFLAALDCRDLQSLEVYRSVVPSGFVAVDLIRASAAKGVFQLRIHRNNTTPPHGLSDDDVLDFFFPADAAQGGPERSLVLDGTGVTDTFAAKFFERFQSSPVRPSGSLTVYGATADQRGLSVYAHYLASGGMVGTIAVFRFPPTEYKNKFYEISLDKRFNFLAMHFCLVGHPSE